MEKPLQIVCFGEVLWDVFPGGEKIGGAPLNVALRLQSLGNEVTMISSVGKDERGKKLVDYMQSHGLNTDYIHLHQHHKTGEALIALGPKGNARYEFPSPCAWDEIAVSEAAKTQIKSADAFVYGSLGIRNIVSRENLLEALSYAGYKVFDVNLRPPYYQKDYLIPLMEQADFIKFNDEELFEVGAYLDSRYHSLEQTLWYVAEKTNTKHACVTKGRHGAVLLYNGQLYYNSGYHIKVADTVGAGDSFLAALISSLLRQKPPQEAIDFACATGALVAQSEGANPDISLRDIEGFMYPG